MHSRLEPTLERGRCWPCVSPRVSVTEPTLRRRRRPSLTNRMVATLPRKRRRYTVTDPEQRGHYVRVPTDGPAVYVAVARNPYGKQVWATLGSADVMAIERARER